VTNCDQCPKRATTNLCDEHAAEIELVHDELRAARRQLERIASAVVEVAKKADSEYDWCFFCECHPSNGHAEDCAVQICEDIVGGER
jgi:hypothetical protein